MAMMRSKHIHRQRIGNAAVDIKFAFPFDGDAGSRNRAARVNGLCNFPGGENDAIQGGKVRCDNAQRPDEF
jgi:hypothetical protein